VAAAGPPRWGFHRLSPSWARRIVQGAGIRPGDLVIDLGAGTGCLTSHLVEAGARVLAVELHPGRARQLRDRFGPQVRVIQSDATTLQLPRRPFRVVANPPFASSAALLRRLVAESSHLVRADVVVPAQTAARWANGRAGGAGHRPDLYAARIAMRLPAQAFRPAAPLATSVLRLDRRDDRRARVSFRDG
jgi:23S rRNA (adenine-N6)-dimethyltransferase